MSHFMVRMYSKRHNWYYHHHIGALEKSFIEENITYQWNDKSSCCFLYLDQCSIELVTADAIVTAMPDYGYKQSVSYKIADKGVFCDFIPIQKIDLPAKFYSSGNV